MSRSAVLTALLAMACLCLAGMTLTYAQINASERRRRRLAQRMAAVLGPGSGEPRADSAVPARVVLTIPSRRRPAGARVAAAFGADLARQELYPFKWWLVPPACLLPGKLAALLLGFLVGGASSVALPLVCWVCCRKFFDHFHQKRITILFKQLPDALAMIVRAVRVGNPISEAIKVVGREAPEPTKSEFMRLGEQITIGVALDEALRTMAERTTVPEYRFFATSISLQSQTGGGISETLDNLADVIRKRVAAKARGKALASEARASALALSVLPLLSMLSLYILNPGYIAVLFDTKPGHKILAGATILLCFGTFVMRTIIQKGLS